MHLMGFRLTFIALAAIVGATQMSTTTTTAAAVTTPIKQSSAMGPGAMLSDLDLATSRAVAVPEKNRCAYKCTQQYDPICAKRQASSERRTFPNLCAMKRENYCFLMDQQNAWQFERPGICGTA